MKSYRKDFKKFRQISEGEMRVKDQLNELALKNFNKMNQELTTLKTVLEVPRLRVEIKKLDFSGKNFEDFL